MLWVSDETAPNLPRSSTRASAIRLSGTGWPSLKLSGSRISNRRPEVLISRLALNFKGDAFTSKIRQDSLVDHQVAVIPGFEGESARQPAQRAVFFILAFESQYY